MYSPLPTMQTRQQQNSMIAGATIQRSRRASLRIIKRAKENKGITLPTKQAKSSGTEGINNYGRSPHGFPQATARGFPQWEGQAPYCYLRTPQTRHAVRIWGIKLTKKKAAHSTCEALPFLSHILTNFAKLRL